MAQVDTQAQKTATCEQHKQAHIAYWKEHNRPTDPKRFEDGFNAGWCDAEDPACPDISRDSLLGQREGENVKACGQSDCEWAFGDGYHEGFDARCDLNKSNEDTHPQKVAACEEHKQAHIKYWQEHGNRPTDPKRFEDGFIQGWCDAENNRWPGINRDSLLCHRQDENVKQCGNSPCEWAFDDGYHEGFDARRCLKPEAPACPPASAPAPAPVASAPPPAQPPTDANHQCTDACGHAPDDSCTVSCVHGSHSCADDCKHPPSGHCDNGCKHPRTHTCSDQCSHPPNGWCTVTCHHGPSHQCTGACNHPKVQQCTDGCYHPPSHRCTGACTHPPLNIHHCSSSCDHPPNNQCTPDCDHGPSHECSQQCCHPTTKRCSDRCKHKRVHRCTSQCTHPPNDWCITECSHGTHACTDQCAHPTTKHCNDGCKHPKAHRCTDQCAHDLNYCCTLECKHGSHQCSAQCNHPRTAHCGNDCQHDGWMLLRRTLLIEVTQIVEIVEIDVIEIDVIEVGYVRVDEPHVCTDECRDRHQHEGLLQRLEDALNL